MLKPGTYKTDKEEILVFEKIGYSIPFWVIFADDGRELHILRQEDGKYFVYLFDDSLKAELLSEDELKRFLKENDMGVLLEPEKAILEDKIVRIKKPEGEGTIDYFLYRGEGHLYGGKMKIDFTFPNGKGIFPTSYENYVLRGAPVPYTKILVSNARIDKVIWVIERPDGYIHVMNYPFNTANLVCSRLNELLKKRLSVSPLNWYAEPPGNDIPSIRMEFMPVLAYALKNDVHELLPFLEKDRLNSDAPKIGTISFDLRFKFRHPQGEVFEERDYKLELPLKIAEEGEKKLAEFALKKTGPHASDVIELEGLKTQE